MSVPMRSQRFGGRERRLGEALLKTRDVIERTLGQRAHGPDGGNP